MFVLCYIFDTDYVTNLSARCGQAFKMHYDVMHGYHVRLMVAANTSMDDFPSEFNVVSTIDMDSFEFLPMMTDIILSSCRSNEICAH